MTPRRDYGAGSVYQRCEIRYGCPALVDGVRPKHDCQGRWFGAVDKGYTASGARRRLTVSAKTKSAAQRKLRDLRAQLDRNDHAPSKRNTTVGRWVPEWLEKIQPRVRPSAYETDKAAMRWVVSTIGGVKLTELSPAHVRSVAAAIRRDGKSTSTALRYHGSLMRMLKAATVEGYNVPPNVLLAEAPKAAVNDRRAIPMADTMKIFDVIRKQPDGSRWALGFLQGIRQAEALGLCWENVGTDSMTVCWQVQRLRYVDRHDPEKGFVIPDGYEVRHLIGATHLVRPKSKAGWRVIPLISWAAQSLEEWREIAPDNPHGLVWPGRIDRRGAWPRNPASDRDAFDALQDAAEVRHPTGRHYTVHEMRNTTATLLMELKIPESVRIAIMGHSSITTTRGYEHVDIAQARLALEQVGGLLGLPG